MKISNNIAGNYNPLSYNNINKVQTPKPVQEPAEEAKKILSADEKNFFAKMYPEKNNEIQGYHFYGRNGQMNGVSVGANFDRRG